MAISSGSSVSQTRLSGEMAVGGRGEGQRGDMGKEFGRITEPFSRICKKGRNARERGDICKCHHGLHPPSHSVYLLSDD